MVQALLPAFALFVVWDLWATRTGTWDFNPDYTIGLTLPGGMAIEELVFFTVIPVCGLLTLETVRRILAAGDIGLMPIYPTLAVAAAVAVLLLRSASCAPVCSATGRTGSRWRSATPS